MKVAAASRGGEEWARIRLPFGLSPGIAPQTALALLTLTLAVLCHISNSSIV